MLQSLVVVLCATAALTAQSFGPVETFFGPPRQALAFVTGDFDGDGDIDVVTQAPNGYGLWWELHRNDGEGMFAAELLPSTVPPTGAQGLVAADLDGNGTLDMACSGGPLTSLPHLIVFLNNGLGVFQEVHQPITLDYVRDIEPLDFDGDGDLDLAVAIGVLTGQPTPSRLLENDGSGNFTDVTAALMPNPSISRIGLAVLDVQGDGLADVVLDGWPLHAMLRGPGPGFVHSPTAFATGAVLIDAIDADADGDLDLVGLRTDALAIYRNDGGGTFTESVHLVTGIMSYRHGDIDGDGDPDFVTASTSGAIRLWRNDPGPVLTEVTATQLPSLRGTSIPSGGFLDSDGDGDQDLWLPWAGPLMHNDGTGRFVRLGIQGEVTIERGAVVLDFDGDGNVDLLGLAAPGTAPTTADLAWWRNDGLGHHVPASTLATVPLCDETHITAFDIDGDGDLDPWLLQCGSNRIWRNDGGGVLTEVTATAFPVDTRADIVELVRDFDGDGDLDVFVPRDLLYDSLYVNDGTGTFTEEGYLRLLDNELTVAAAALDYDGDGDFDIALVEATTTLRLFANDSTGYFTEVSQSALPALAGLYQHVIAFDCDGDGDDDLLLTRTATSLLLRNDGGVFVDASTQLGGAANGRWPEALDFDLDGDIDVMHGDTWLVNDGHGLFTAATPTMHRGDFRHHLSAAFADVDDDGDPDLIYGTLRANLHRHLDNALPPRLGLHGEVRLHARDPIPGFAPFAILFASARLAAAPIPVPPLGALHLEPTTLMQLGVYPVPTAQGYGAARYLVPNDPTLIGVTIPMQALIVHGPTQAHTSNTIVVSVEL